jgi:hypothetical protein
VPDLHSSTGLIRCRPIGKRPLVWIEGQPHHEPAGFLSSSE